MGLQVSNALAAQGAASREYSFADYYSALADPQGYILPACSDYGVHPNAAGYEKMTRVLDAAFDTLLRSINAIRPLTTL